MVEALFAGQALTATELASVGRVGPSTASEHLGALVKGSLLRVRRQGRHRYYQLSSPRVATALEAFAEICPPAQVRSLRQATRVEALRAARTCYDHVAGRLGVAVLDALLAKRWLIKRSTEIQLTPRGERGLMSIGIEVGALRRQPRPLVRFCLDSTERRPHLGGALGAALSAALTERDWIRRRPPGRSLVITSAGATGLTRAFGLPPSTSPTAR